MRTNNDHSGLNRSPFQEGLTSSDCNVLPLCKKFPTECRLRKSDSWGHRGCPKNPGSFLWTWDPVKGRGHLFLHGSHIISINVLLFLRNFPQA